MKICFIAPANNYHTQKWCKWFSQNGHHVDVVSFTKGEIENVTVHYVDSGVSVQDSDSKKIKYLLYARKVKKIVDLISPDIVNVHYATSYGTVAALSGLNGYVLSVWGADVYDFPSKSLIHKMMLKYSLNHAEYLFSTSKAMAKETRQYTSKKIFITPFGVDIDMFSPDLRNRSDDGYFIIGTVKSLTEKYGIEYILRAAAIIRKERPDINMKIRIAGKGNKAEEYHELAKKLMLNDIVEWLGFIPQDQAAKEWANMDVAIVYSTLDSESFGVSAVEAEACGSPVIIADIPGLMEATEPDKTSIVVKRKDERLLADAIIRLYDDPLKRTILANNGFRFVRDNYELNNCFRRVEKIYQRILEKR